MPPPEFRDQIPRGQNLTAEDLREIATEAITNINRSIAQGLLREDRIKSLMQLFNTEVATDFLEADMRILATDALDVNLWAIRIGLLHEARVEQVARALEARLGRRELVFSSKDYA